MNFPVGELESPRTAPDSLYLQVQRGDEKVSQSVVWDGQGKRVAALCEISERV